MKNLLYLVFSIFILYSCNQGGQTSETDEGTATDTQSAATNSPAATSGDPLNDPTAAAPAEPPTGNAAFTFEKNEHDFGKIGQENKVSYTFKFTNSGTEPLIIADAKGSCGCTVPEYSKEPIPVGGSGEIKVEFDPKGKKGVNRKTVTVTANTNPSRSTLQIVADIQAPEGEENKEAVN